MKNLTSKIGKYLSQLGTQLLKVLWSDDLRLEFLLVLFETFFQIVVLLIFLSSQINILQI